MSKYKNKSEVFDYLNQYSKLTKSEIDSHHTKKNLLKSYVFETFSEDLPLAEAKEILKISNLFYKDNHTLVEVDDDLFLLSSEKEVIGFIEQISNRFSVLYSTLPSSVSDSIIAKIIKESPILESLWISGHFFDDFLNQIITSNQPNRFTNIKFESKNLHHLLLADSDFHESESSTSSLNQNLGGLEQKIKGIREFLPMFHSISSLRFPSNGHAGGHDVYFNGKVTNRSSDFFEHRFQILEIINQYNRLTTTIEDICWLEFKNIPEDKPNSDRSFKAAPITIKLGKSLDDLTLDYFVNQILKKGTNPFKIIGDVKKINNYRYHIYGTDLHIWQNIFIDIGLYDIILYLPKGTSGNTIHRFITNVQKFISPEIDVYIGDISYKELIYNSRSIQP